VGDAHGARQGPVAAPPRAHCAAAAVPGTKALAFSSKDCFDLQVWCSALLRCVQFQFQSMEKLGKVP
jgi:hypothetical protein